MKTYTQNLIQPIITEIYSKLKTKFKICYLLATNDAQRVRVYHLPSFHIGREMSYLHWRIYGHSNL